MHAGPCRRDRRRPRRCSIHPAHPVYAPASRRHAAPGDAASTTSTRSRVSCRICAVALPPCRFSARCERRQPICDEAAAALDRIVGRRMSCAAGFRCDGAAARSQVARPNSIRSRELPAVPSCTPSMMSDLTIGAGESVGLVGESGCGKSTMVRLLGRLIDPTTGRSCSAATTSPRCRRRGSRPRPDRRRIQVVFQDPTESLNPSFRVFQSIADPLKRLLDLRNGAEIETARPRDGRAGRVAATNLLQRYPHQLSGGQRARVGIARAVAVEPSLLDPGRADLGARCVGPGGDPAAAGRSARPAGDELPVRVARPQRGAASVFARRRHVSRQDRRDRAGGGALHRAASPLYAGAGRRDPRSRATAAKRGRASTAVRPARSIRTRTPAASTAAVRRAPISAPTRMPPLRAVGPDHFAACHFALSPVGGIP